jgi:hypothetical protein
MDAKLTLCFDEHVIAKSKKFAAKNNISLSRLVEFLLSKTTSESYASLEALPVADWVLKVSEGNAEYKHRKRSRREMKNEFLASKK